MQDDHKNLFLRNDTIFGVCEGLGQDLGVNPNIFRIAFAGLLYFYPVGVVAAYLGLGIVIAVSRWVYPRGGSASSAANEGSHVARPQPANCEEAASLAA